MTQREQERSNIKRALRLAKEGAYGKAYQALSSGGVLPPSAGVSEALRAKHLQTTPMTDTSDYEVHEDSPTITPFTSEGILRAVHRFPVASAARGSGLLPNHLEEVLRVPCSTQDGGLLEALTRSGNVLALGKAPPVIAPCIAGAPLTALSKRDGGVRPIAVAETLRGL